MRFFLSYLPHVLDAAATERIPSALSSILDSIHKFLVDANPIILIILGIVVFLAGKFAKVIGIIIVLLGLILLLLPFLSQAL